MKIADDIALIWKRLYTLTWRLHHDFSEEGFGDNVKEVIEHIRIISDLKSMLSNVEEKGNLLFGKENSNTFLKSTRVLANTITTIPDNEFILAYKSFLRNLKE